MNAIGRKGILHFIEYVLYEYFYSKCERKIDYNSIDVPQVLSILNQDTKDLQQYCKYCPQGIFQDIRIS